MEEEKSLLCTMGQAERAHIEPGQFKEIDKYNKIYASFEYSIIYRLYQTYKNVK